MTRFNYRCPNCQSNNVVCDATIRWDIAKQGWEICDHYDSAYCCDCDEDINFVEKHELEEEG